jgi:hypothetical protein
MSVELEGNTLCSSRTGALLSQGMRPGYQDHAVYDCRQRIVILYAPDGRFSISTIPIDWGKRACSSTHDFDGSSRNCCACVPREASLDRLGMPRARQRTYPCFQGKLNAQFQVEGQSKFSYPIACKFRNGFLAYGFNWELFTIDQFLCVENAIVQCQIDPLPGDERAWRGTDASAGGA